jgi:hypothetical protein
MNNEPTTTAGSIELASNLNIPHPTHIGLAGHSSFKNMHGKKGRTVDLHIHTVFNLTLNK